MHNPQKSASLWHSAKYRSLLLLAILVFTAIIFAIVDLTPTLAHMKIAMLSGPQDSRSYQLVEKIKSDAADNQGSVSVTVTTGADESIKRLLQKQGTKSDLFAVVPNVLHYPQAEQLKLIARLPDEQALFLLGADGSRIRYLADMKAMRIGIGPAGSATQLIGETILGAADLGGLDFSLTHHPFAEQVGKLLDGALDAALFVMPKDSPMIKKALQDGLEIISFDNLEAIAARFPGLHSKTLYAGYYDHVKLLPQQNKKLLYTDTLVLSNHDAARSDIVALLVLLDQTFHHFIDYNRKREDITGLTQSTELKHFLGNNGPTFLDQYLPGVINFMPPANLLHYVVVVSVLFNLMTAWNKLRLYLIDSRRTKLEDQLFELFGRQLTFEEINKLNLSSDEIDPHFRQNLDELIAASVALRDQCRKYVPTFITPLGQENIYRFHEGLIADQLNALLKLRERID